MTFTLKCNKRKYHILQVRCGIPKCSSFTSSLHTPVRAKQNKVQLHQNGAASSLSHKHARTHTFPSKLRYGQPHICKAASSGF